MIVCAFVRCNCAFDILTVSLDENDKEMSVFKYTIILCLNISRNRSINKAII